MTPGFVLERLEDAPAPELDNDVAVFRSEGFVSEAFGFAVLAVGFRQGLDKEFAVLATLTELKLYDQFGGVLKDNPAACWG